MSNLLAALPTTYRSQPVLPYLPNGGDTRGHQWDEPSATLATASGLTVVSADMNTTPQGVETFPLQYVGLTRADARAIEQFVEDRAGRFEGFWCPTFQHEFFTVARPAATGGLFVREWGYATSIFPLGLGYDHLFAMRGALRFIGPLQGVADTGTTDTDGSPIWTYGFFGSGTAGDASTLLVDGHPAYSGIGLRVARCLWARFADDACTTEWAHPNLASITLRVVDNSADAP